MYEDADYEKAIMLHEMDEFLELSLDELAKRIYERRQHNTSEDDQSLVHGDK